MLMAVMMSPREKWTDERLDDLQVDMNRRFNSIDASLIRIEHRFEKLETRIDAKFDGLTKVLIGSAAGIIAALIGLIATQM